MKSGGRWLVAVLVVAAVGALVWLAIHEEFPPRAEEASGTIGGVERVERFRGQGLQDGDVQLADPELQQLLQNEQLLALIRDGSFQRALRNESVRQMFAQDAFQNQDVWTSLGEMYAVPEFRQVAANGAFSQSFAHPVVRKSIDQPFFARVLDNDDMRQALRDPQVVEALSRLLVEVPGGSELERQFVAGTGWDTFVKDRPEFEPLASNTFFQQAMTSETLRQGLFDGGMRDLLADAAARQSFFVPDMLTAFDSPPFRAAVFNPQIVKVFANDKVRDGLLNSAFVSALKSDSIRQAFFSEGIWWTFRRDSFQHALASGALLQDVLFRGIEID